MSFPRYPRYKDSGVEWLGEVPEHWEVRRMKQCIARLYSGGTPDSGNAAFWAEDEDPESTAWVAIGDMTRSPLVNSTDRRLTKAGRESKRLDLVPAGTLLYSIYASLGKVAVLDVDATVNQAIIGIAPDPQIISREFLRYWLLHVEQFLGVHSSSNTQDNLSAAKVRSLSVIAPPRAEQDGIVQLLDRETTKIDELIAEQRRLIELLKEKRQAVISHAVTRGLNPDAPMKPSGVEWLGDVPAHWEVLPLKRLWNVTDCKHVTAEFVEDGYPLASIREVQGQYVELDAAKRTTPDFYELLIEGGRKPQAGNLIFSRNATVGEVAQVTASHPPFAMGQDVCLLRPSAPSSSSDFMQAVLKSDLVGAQLACLMIGSTFKRVNVEEIRNLMSPFPPDNEQQVIAAYVKDEAARFDDLVTDAVRAITLLQERRTALISAAVTGKIDVRGIAQAEAA